MKSVFVLLALIAVVSATFGNGQFDVGEVYPHSFSTGAYSVHELPYGITFSTLVYDAMSSSGAFVVPV